MHRLKRILPIAVAAMLSVFSVTAAVPASATPATANYSISTGPRVAYTHPFDSPATPYTDKDGTFYFQQSEAIYGATDPRKWDFYTGTNFDTATRSSAISDAVNPANSNDRNNDTTWRCNNSPTGVEATYAPTTANYSQKNYCDLIGVWVDPDTGTWYGLVHNEFTPEPWGPYNFSHYDAIDVAVSTDRGKVWTITGHAITSPYSTVRGDTAAFPNQTWDYGDGDPRLFVDAASAYFYVYYASRIQPKPGVSGGITSLAHVARAPISSKMASGSWKKWFNGSWTEPGIGGRESNMVPVDASHPTGYTPVANDYNPANTGSVDQQIAAGVLPSKSDLLTMNIAYDAYLGLYIGEPEVLDQSVPTPQRYYVTDDLSTQKWQLIGDSGSFTTDSWYRWMLDGASKTGTTIVGKTYRSYCSFSCGGSTSGDYHDVTIGSSNPAQPPADPAKTYLIGNGNGRILAQLSGGNATTSVAAATGSALEGWAFSGLGDGSYQITNAATGQALGVDSTTTATRAWGSKPTVTSIGSGGPSVGQQWFILPNSSGPTYRLVNRYSGLELGLSADSARLAETTPGRTWTNTTGNPVGGSRTAAEQTLTFTPIGTSTNIALGRPTTASSSQSATLSAANATDGNAATRWSSAFSDPQWIQVDLGQSYHIIRAVLTWESAYASGYQIQTSPDGANWTTIYSTSSGDGGVDDLALNGTGRYLRMYGTQRATGYGYSLWEFAVEGTPVGQETLLSQGRPTTASSTETTALSAGNATDGNAGTRWSSSFSDPQWIQVDLGSTHPISRVQLNWEAAYASAFQLQTSTDGTTWTNIYSTTNATGGTQNLTVSGTGRYIRMYGTQRATSYGYSLWEFQAFGA